MKWRIRDIIDLEYFLHQDAISSVGAQEHIQERDRRIFLKLALPGTPGGAVAERRWLLRAWLDRRREEAGRATAVLPGESYDSLYTALRVLFLGAGLAMGAAAGGSFLTYSGNRPVNVFVYLAAFVASQQLLLLLLLALSLYRLAVKSPPAASPLYKFIGRSMLRMLVSARTRLSEKRTAAQRLQTEALAGTILGKTRGYGSLLFLPVFLLTQLFAIGFNLGLLGSTLFKVVTADIAFGWQSTIQMSPAAVHFLVEKLALPWSWAVGGETAFPSLAQIEGSRIILKEGIYNLSTPDLVSWWPFLCLAVLVYGLLPRLLLCLGGALALRRRLAALEFRQGDHEQLLLRMTTPLVTTRGQSVAGADDAAADPALAPAPVRATATAGSAARKLLVLIPAELYDLSAAAEIAAAVSRGGAVVEEIIPTGRDYDADRALLADLRTRAWPAETSILLIQEAWQPPIMEYIDFIKQLRQAVGNGPGIRIGLIGKPGPDTIFTRAAEVDRKIWARKIAASGDPGISCEGLVDHAT